MSVDIILATYNGEKYIAEQIDSILNQSFSDFILYIRDDGSTDNTVDIIRSYKDQRVKFLVDEKKCCTAGRNFCELLKKTTSDYVFFADQDDVWLPNKVERTLKHLREINGAGLVYVNGRVVNKDLIDLSVNVYPLTMPAPDLRNLFFLNGGVQGCALAINRDLLNLINDYDHLFWHMHDQVVTFYAALYGKIVFIDEILFLYRQHENNVIGHQNKGYFKALFSQLKKERKDYLIHYSSLQFIKSFYKIEKNRMDRNSLEIFQSFFSFISSGKLISIFSILMNGFSLKGSKVRLLVKSIFTNKVESQS
ncbi:glycosyltransferase family 2 protein [Xenorhabdus sp. SF857]|uniref:glycosyltransferase family 2 protein n=1 Tax=Xenorhabdus bakwenae TaxID=3026967 RepID=UPI0025581CDD|nr:glycosyltransferase family 2 protein [Xenorhabdus sp. SF857]WFQ78874.1 glycosyltransferase family 2 protein [Xenorhabdus sp. SF857]